MNFYNEFDPAAAAWLRELIARRLIPNGVVDERSISDLKPSDLHGYTQCHFFAGIGGWSLALELVGVDPARSLWTGSCPCQPYSAAGKGLGDEDPRNLWPAFFRLIRECRPELVLGEQVADAIGKGWLDRVSADMEGEGYACGAAVLGAHSVGAPHIRKRLYWVADAQLARREAPRLRSEIDARREPEPGRASCGMAESHRIGSAAGISGPEQGQEGFSGEPDDSGGERLGGMGDSHGAGCEARDIEPVTNAEGSERALQSGSLNPWSDSYWLLCRDGKHRRVPTEPALFPLADGLPYKLARRGSIRPALLKGAGNAIVPQVAAEFISAYLETLTP